jgi:hypothetical protein
VPLGAIAAVRDAAAQYPSTFQIAKDGTAVVLQDYASLPLSSRSASINFTNQLGRVNFLRSEPANAAQSAARFFVNDLNRNLYILDKSSRAFSPYLNFSTIFPKFDNDPGLAGGLVTFAFDPEYASNGKFYTVHTEDPAIAGAGVPNNFPGFSNAGYTTTAAVNPPAGTVSRQGVLVEWTDSDTSNGTFAGSAREVLRVGFNTNIHPMGDLIFNPLAAPGDADYRNLYISNGDGGAGEVNGSERTIPQRLDALPGKILRITPDVSLRPATSTNINGRYSVPTSGADANPFVDVSGARKEVFAYGLRNPHRMTWDEASNKLMTLDIGLGSWEEVNIVTKGANYGYSEREGIEQLFVGPTNNGLTGSQTNPVTPHPNPDTLTVSGVGSVTPIYPAANFSHRDGDAISSGFVYRGTLMPELVGKFVYGDIVTGRLFYSDYAEMLASDDGVRTTVADIHELQVVYDSPLDAGPGLAKRRLFDIVVDEFTHKGGDTNIGYPALPGYGNLTGGWRTGGYTSGLRDYEGVLYPGGRADIRLALGGDGELYVLSKSDGMVRQLIGGMHFWDATKSGNWGDGTNWTNGAADGIGYAALFGAAGAARNVSVNGERTAGLLYFNSPSGPYTLAGSTIRLDATAPQASIQVIAGNHTIAAPLELIDSTSISVLPAGATLTVANLQPGTLNLSKSGAGTLVVNNLRAGALAIDGGTVRVVPGGGPEGVSRVSSVTVAAGAKLDLTDNRLIVTAQGVGAWNGAAYSGVTGMIANGRFMSSSISTLTGLAVARAGDVGKSTFDGFSVSADDVLVMLTYKGDANLSGFVDADDYFAIDSNYNKPVGTLGYAKGDFDFSGVIDGDDFALIDASFSAQGSAIGAGAGFAVVPEPGSAAVIAAGLSSLTGRRRRKAHGWRSVGFRFERRQLRG